MTELAILLFVGAQSFGCLPPPGGDLNWTPYRGPWTMTVEQAELTRAARTDVVRMVRSSDPDFAVVKAFCPPVALPIR